MFCIGSRAKLGARPTLIQARASASVPILGIESEPSSSAPPATAKSRPFTAVEFSIPPDPRHSRDPHWPKRLTLSAARSLSVDEFKTLLTSGRWQITQLCNGEPVLRQWLTTTRLPDYWETGRYELSFENGQFKRELVYPAQAETKSYSDETPYEVRALGSNIFEIDYEMFKPNRFQVQSVNETGELVLTKPERYQCPDDSVAQSWMALVDPFVS